MEYLQIVDGTSGESYEVPLERGFIALGSAGDNSIVLPGTEPHHLEVVRIEQGVKLVDRHTETGVQVNGEWIVQKILEHGDIITVGPHRLVFKDRKREGRPPARARPAPAARGPLRAVVMVFLAGCGLLAAYLAFRQLSSESEAPPPLARHEPAFAKVAGAKAAGHFEAARELLRLIASDSDPEVAARLARERTDLDLLEALDREARIRLEALSASLGRDALDDVAASYSVFTGEFGELEYLKPQFEEFERALDGARRLQAEGLAAEVSEEKAASRADAMLAAGDFSSALKAWERFLPRDDSARARQQAAVAVIRSKAREEANRLLAAIAVLAEEKKFEEIVDLVGDSDLAKYRNTPLYDPLVDQVAAAERGAGLGPRALRPADLPPLDVPGSEPAAPAEAAAEREAAAASPPPAAATELEPAIPEFAFREVDAAIRDWAFDKAVSILQGLMPEARTREEKQRISARLEFAHRQVWFIDDLQLKVSDDPVPASRVTIKTRERGFRGRFHSYADSKLLIESADDLQAFPFQQIEPLSLYRLAKAYPLTPEERLNLASFCLNNRLETEFEELAAGLRSEGSFKRSIEAFLAMERGTSAAVDFGYRMLNGRLVPHHEWRQAILDREIKALEQKVASSDPAARNEGYRGFLDLGPVSYDALEGILTERYAALARKLAAFPETAKLEKLADAKKRLNAALAFALELIFDEARYFYPYGHAQGEYNEVQREVDRRVEAVREVWGNEFTEDVPGLAVKLSPQFLAVRDDLNQMARILKDITDGDFERSVDLGAANLIPARGRVVNVRTFALDAEEWESIDSSAAILEYNEKLDSTASRSEREQVWITNRYRMMMGRRALALNELILQAARGHSDWMSRTGTFSHFEDTDERRTPGDRMAQAGYERGSGENIHAGAGSAMAAHLGWYHSSGHHRNMLAPGHTEMACGVVGPYWTQNFGGGTEFSENLIGE